MRGDTSTSNPASYCLAVHLRNLKGWEMAWPAVARLTTLNSWGKFRAALEDGRLPHEHGKRVVGVPFTSLTAYLWVFFA